MKWFNDLKVAYKVLINCAMMILLVVAAVFFSINAMSSVKSRVTDFTYNSVVPVIKMDAIDKNILKGRLASLQMAEANKSGNTAEAKRLLDEIIQIRKENQENLKIIKERKMSREELELTEQYISDYALMGEKMKAYMDSKASGTKEQQTSTLTEWVKQYETVMKRLNELENITYKLGSEKIKQEFIMMDRVMIILIFILVFSVTAGVILTLVLSSAVSKPVKKSLEFAELIADGNFLERIDLNQKDELGQLGKALNKSADNLEILISEIVMSSQNLVRVIEEIASGNENLSQRTSEQASSLEEIAATVEETNASTKQNSGNARDADQLAGISSQLAIDGGLIVDKAVLSIGEINNSSKQISEIINMINEISFQTNLLALNASVEAARAGDHGRGFAVVAGEVRNLSQRSASAAKEIGTLIKNSIDKINEGTDLVNNSGKALKDIILSATKVKNIISEISASSDEQTKGIEQINIAITDMDTMTQQNAALVEQTAAASQEMTNQAKELLTMVQRFKIRESLIVSAGYTKQTTNRSGSSITKKTDSKSHVTKPSVIRPKSETYNPENDGYEKF